jgi:hypothetical protein
MASFIVTIPDDYIPAIEAEFLVVSAGGGTSANNSTEYFQASVVETVRQKAELYKVGSYHEGVVTVQPKFLTDGRGNPNYTGSDAVTYKPNYPADNGGTPWANGDQWTDSVTSVVYTYTDGSWEVPA